MSQRDFLERHLPGCLGALCCMRAEVRDLQSMMMPKDRKKNQLEPLIRAYPANNHSMNMEGYCYPNELHRMRTSQLTDTGPNFHVRQGDDGSLSENFKRLAPDGKTFLPEKRNSGSGISPFLIFNKKSSVKGLSLKAEIIKKNARN
ncbi:hypothetical protein Ciccas_009220 [Cichlidogyrus casuarinus]|uniref:Uncharacterized protein n=1 Tax=Cichlidogyrus casuarinus TaxID=1844966 RepID=A0ABD2PZD4_9PLAT